MMINKIINVRGRAIRLNNKATSLFWIALPFGLAMTFSFNATAQCSEIPTCESLGYDETEADCSGKYLKCPFDNAKVFCQGGAGSVPEEVCLISSILYSDKSCSSNLLLGKTVVGIVVDPIKKLAIALTEVSKPWNLSTSEINFVDIPDLTNYTSSATALTDFNGKANTALILAYNSNYQAAKHCNDMSLSGTSFSAGNWYLPALGELSLIYANKTDLNMALSKIASSMQLNTMLNGPLYWSSSEASYSRAWYQSLYSGIMGGSGKYDNGKSASFFVRCMVQY